MSHVRKPRIMHFERGATEITLCGKKKSHLNIADGWNAFASCPECIRQRKRFELFLKKERQDWIVRDQKRRAAGKA